MADLSFSCCFCDQEVEDPDLNPQVVVVFMAPDVKDHLEQYWFCHFECFEESLHPRYREFRQEWHEAKEELDADLQ